MKKTIVVLILLISSASFAKLNDKNIDAFLKTCLKKYSGLQKKENLCSCEKLNFTWLLHNETWIDFEKIYFANSDDEKIEITDDLEALDTVIYEVKTKCYKKQSYVAPKARRLRSEARIKTKNN